MSHARRLQVLRVPARVCVAAVRRAPDHIVRLLSYLSVSRHLERMADYVASIAEDVIYMATGEIVPHRPSENPSPRRAGNAGTNRQTK